MSAWTLTDHQPAPEPEPEPEPEWDGFALYVAKVRGVPGVRVTWSPVDDEDVTPWLSTEVVERHRWHRESDLADVRPLVVLDPAVARKALEDNGWGEHETNEILHELRIEASS